LGTRIHSTELTLLILVVLVALLATLAHRVKTPYPIVLVLGGLCLSFVPAIPHVSINPTFVFLVILPPLLFASALNTAWREFRFHLVSIAMLGVGLVACTVAGVAVVLHFFMSNFDWRNGAVLGAVVSTTDAIAVAAIASRVGLPDNLLAIIEGESLVNDATGLLALQFTTALVTSGEIPSFGEGVSEFLWLIVGGILAGLLVAILTSHFDRLLFRRFPQASELQILVSIATPYFAYLFGESMHASGVLATVACGLYIGRTTSQNFSSRARLESRAIWTTIDFVLNGLVFIVIGLQLPVVLNGMRDSRGHLNWPQMIEGAALVCLIVIALRMLLVFPGSQAAWFLRTRVLRQQIPRPTPGELTVVGWSGMRGVLTLAAALSLPEVLDTGAPFPQRHTIIFFAFAVILVTLVGQGLSLPTLIRKLRVGESPETMLQEDQARSILLKSALKTLRGLSQSEDETESAAAEMLTRYYRQRLDGLDSAPGEAAQLREQKYQALSAKVRQAEREQISRLRQQGTFRESTLRDLERELDLIDLRWEKS
jgi:monovalent cation/hydrogen antiporter